jgi:hypothetical protein
MESGDLSAFDAVDPDRVKKGLRQIPGGFEIILTFPVDISSFFSAEKNEAKRSLKKRCIHRSSLLCQLRPP